MAESNVQLSNLLPSHTLRSTTNPLTSASHPNSIPLSSRVLSNHVGNTNKAISNAGATFATTSSLASGASNLASTIFSLIVTTITTTVTAILTTLLTTVLTTVNPVVSTVSTVYTTLTHVTPLNYLLLLTGCLILFLGYLILPRGVRAQYCGAYRKRYRRHGGHGGQSGTTRTTTTTRSAGTTRSGRRVRRVRSRGLQTERAFLSYRGLRLRGTLLASHSEKNRRMSLPQHVLENVYAHTAPTAQTATTAPTAHIAPTQQREEEVDLLDPTSVGLRNGNGHGTHGTNVLNGVNGANDVNGVNDSLLSTLGTPSPQRKSSEMLSLCRASEISSSSGSGMKSNVGSNASNVGSNGSNFGSNIGSNGTNAPRLGMIPSPSSWKKGDSSKDGVPDFLLRSGLSGTSLKHPPHPPHPPSIAGSSVGSGGGSHGGIHGSIHGSIQNQITNQQPLSLSSFSSFSSNPSMVHIRQLLKNPPGLRLIAHGTKCQPRPVWITLHFSDDPASPASPSFSTSPTSPSPTETTSSTLEDYKHCLTWRAELRPANTANTANPSTTSLLLSPPLSPTQPKLGNLRKVTLPDILGVELGKRTTALRRVQTAKHVKEGDCFSLLTKTGTLDLQCVGYKESFESHESNEFNKSNKAGIGKKNVLAPIELSAEEMRNAIIGCLAWALSSQGLPLAGWSGRSGFDARSGNGHHSMGWNANVMQASSISSRHQWR